MVVDPSAEETNKIGFDRMVDTDGCVDFVAAIPVVFVAVVAGIIADIFVVVAVVVLAAIVAV